MRFLSGLRDRRIQKDAARWRAEMLEPPSPELRAAFDAWLAADPAHAKAYGELGRLTALSQRLPSPQHRVQDGQRGASFRPSFAVVALLTVTLTGVLIVTGREPPASQTSLTNAGHAVRLYQMADGSTVTLDRDTRLDIAMKKSAREVRLRAGRARFEVANEPARPFTVEAGDGRVLANGAEFDVVLDGQQLTVVPLRGPVRAGPAQAGERRALKIALGTAVRIAGTEVIATSVSRRDRLWPAGRLSFDATALATVVAKANRLGGPPIALASEEIGKLQVTAVLDLRDTRALARKLAAALALRVEERGGKLVLTR